MDFTEGRPGKGGEWVMTTSAGEPMILPYDPPAWDPQPQNTTSLLFETSKKMKLNITSQLQRGAMPDYPICNSATPVSVSFIFIHYSMSTLWLVNVAKWSKMVNLPVHLGPFWVHLDPFEPFQAIIDFKLKSASAKEH